MNRLTTTILYMIGCGICWEYILPSIIQDTTSDFWDVVSYTLGGMSYYFISKGLNRIGQ